MPIDSTLHLNAEMMRYCAELVFIFVLSLGNCQSLNQRTLLPNILVLEVNGLLTEHTLTCLEMPAKITGDGADIIWKKNGVTKTQKGNSYILQLEESLGGGNYTCHSKDGSILNYTDVLIHEDERDQKKILLETDTKEYLKCFTQNYSGEFQCFWKWNPIRLGRVAFLRAYRGSEDNETQCSVGADGQQWKCSTHLGDISCWLDASRHGLSCLDKQYCPYAEEIHPVHLTIYFRSEHFLIEEYTQRFFFSEIVKPDKVTIKRINRTTVEWGYPNSWSIPYSFFPLTFEIAQIRGCRNCDNPCFNRKKVMLVNCRDICQFKMKRRQNILCVRAKDALCNSQWSEWSLYRQKGKRQPRLHEHNNR